MNNYLNKSINRLHNIKFERFELDQLIKDSVQIKITDVRFKDDEVVRLNFNYCESRKAIYELNGQNVVFEIKADDWYSYHKESEISIKIDGEKKQVVSINQYFKVGDYFFRIESINKQGTLLNLKSVDWNGYPKSNQIGFQAPEIFYNGVNMLDKYKGKYIYLYFWNIDCGACEKGLPKKNKYFNSKKDLFDEKLIPLLISVGKPEQHKRFLKEHNIDWKNIETIGNSELFDLYGISGYPTQYLISPQGEIIEKGNLRIELEKYFINKNDEK